MGGIPPDPPAAVAAIAAAVAASRVTFRQKALFEIACLRDASGCRLKPRDALGILAGLQVDWYDARDAAHQDPTEEVLIFRVPFPGIFRSLYVKVLFVQDPNGELFVLSFHPWGL